ncbi:MAG: hypothetical protein V4671_27935 [Armatimonadota bacterium]
MTPEPHQQQSNYDEWRYWKHWSTGKKIATVTVLVLVLLSHVFFEYILPRLAEQERNAARSAPATTPGLQIPKPQVSIPPNPNTPR